MKEARKEIRRLMDLLKGIQSLEEAYSVLQCVKSIESGGGLKDIKTPKLAEEEDIPYLTMFKRVATSCKWSESEWVTSPMFNREGFDNLIVVFQQEK